MALPPPWFPETESTKSASAKISTAAAPEPALPLLVIVFCLNDDVSTSTGGAPEVPV